MKEHKNKQRNVEGNMSPWKPANKGNQEVVTAH